MNKVVLLLLMVGLQALGQSKGAPKETTTKAKTSLDKELKGFKESVRLNDLSSATVYLHYLIQDDSYKAYKDTLALVYLQRGMYFSSYEVANQLEKEAPSSFRKEILAVSSRELNKVEEAIGWYRSLYQEFKSPAVLYELVQLLYVNKNYDEARLATTQLLIELKDEDEAMVTVAKSDGQSTQNIKFKSLVWFMYGAILKETKDAVSEKAAYESALKLNPDYDLALTALASLK
jgi:tetratricopeptide (TPR) repeat protein